MTDEQVAPGERIVTSGGDQIFPKGITVGTVMKVSPGADLFLNIRVKPSASLSRLEEVLVITKKEDRRAVAWPRANSVRAVDILTQRLPSVPDKPASGHGAGNRCTQADGQRHRNARCRQCVDSPAGTPAGNDSSSQRLAASVRRRKAAQTAKPARRPAPSHPAPAGPPTGCIAKPGDIGGPTSLACPSPTHLRSR